MPEGKVNWFDPEIGFGFITPNDGSKDVFVHISAIEASGLSTLRKAQLVAYETVPGREGFEAAIHLKALK